MRAAKNLAILAALLFAGGAAAVLDGEGTGPHPTALSVEPPSAFVVETVPQTSTSAVPVERGATDGAQARASVPQRRLQPRASRSVSTVPRSSSDAWWRLVLCESGGRQDAVGGGGRYLSYFQWLLSTWRAAGGSGDPRNASYEEQLARAKSLGSPGHHWPVCARRAGLA